MKVRLRFSKRGKVRFTSHRDVARMWERAFRRVQLPIAYSEGFSPRPKVSFGLALPTGGESLAEYLDVDVATDVDVSQLPELLSPALPVGIEVQLAEELVGRTVSLQADVVASSWVVEIGGLSVAEAHAAVATALAAPELMVTRERKGTESTDDVRPGIEHLDIEGPAPDGDGVLVHARLANKPRGVRPSEMVLAVFPGAVERRVLRTCQWIERDGARAELMPLDATPAHHEPEAVGA
jgi:radical SAM-linked protein